MSYKTYTEQTTSGFDTNSAASVTTGLNVEPASIALVYIFPDTGSNNVHIVQVQVSPDDTNWQDEPTASITGVGKHVHVDVAGHKYIRVKCSKPEGSTSTVNIHIVPMIEL